jgi:nucleotide-binding universal stress UspA family protein
MHLGQLSGWPFCILGERYTESPRVGIECSNIQDREGVMKCTICKTGHTHPGTATVTLERDNTVVVSVSLSRLRKGLSEQSDMEELFMYRKILAVAFGTELSIKAVKEAARLAKCLAARLFVLHVRSPMDIPHHAAGGALLRVGAGRLADEIDQEERKFLEEAAKLAGSLGIEAETGYVADLSPYKAIIRVAEEQHCDLIVMGTRIRHGIPGYFVKSETQKVLANTEIPVVVVR